jgi:hypothetical protein
MSKTNFVAYILGQRYLSVDFVEDNGKSVFLFFLILSWWF